MCSLISISRGMGGRLLTALVIVLVCQGWAMAQASGTWTQTVGGAYDYNDPLNWSGGTVATGASQTADFSTVDIVGDMTVTEDLSLTIGNMLFGDTNTATGGSWLLGTNNASTITLDNGVVKPNITVNPLVAAVTNDDAAIFHGLVGTMGFNKLGNGILTLGAGAVNTITGGININAGTLRQRAVLSGQVITLANGTTLDTDQSLRNVAVNGAVHSIVVASGNTATIRSNNSVGNISAMGATLNLQVPEMSTLSADDSWMVNGAPAAVNITGSATGSPTNSVFRMRIQAGAFNGANFLSVPVTFDNVMTFVRTNSGGNTVSFGSLSGTSTAILSGGGESGGTAVTYSIGSLNTNTEFAGTIDTASAPVSGTNNGGLNILKVGAGTLTLSGTLAYQPTLNTTSNRRGGVTTVSTGTLKLTNMAAIPAGVTGQNSIVNVLSTGILDVSGSTIPGGYSTSAMQTVLGAGQIAGNYVHDEGNLAPADTIPGATGTNPNPAVPTSVGGTITFANNLSFAGTGNIKFDITSSTATGNDLIQVNGVTDLTGTPTLSPFFLGGFTTGTYNIINSTGGFGGSNPAGWTVNWPGRGTAPTLAVSGNQLQMTVGSASAGVSINWTGAADSIWVAGAAGPLNWHNNGANTADRYFDGDTVTFADTFGPGSTPVTNSTVTLNATVLPLAVTVNNTALNYSITGTGGISGSSTFTKQGAGSLILQTTNSFTGAASIQSGTVDIGGALGALGTNMLTISGNSKLITSSTVNGAGLTNSGLVMTAGSTNTIEVNGTAGQSTVFPALSSSGNVDFITTVAGKIASITGNNLSYTGNLSVSSNSIGMLLRTQGANTGLPGSTVTLGVGGELRDFASSAQTIRLGGLQGDAGSILGGNTGGSGAQQKTWQIGELNTSTTFNGTITNGTGSGGSTAVTHITKVGVGTLTLTGTNDYAGTTTVNGGTLLVNGTHTPNAVITGAAPAYVVNSTGTLGGTGTIGDGVTPVPITVNPGGTLSPGASIGTLSVLGDVVLNSNAIFKAEVDGTSSMSDLLAVTGNLTLNGSPLVASLLAGTLPTGPHIIATYTGALTGTFAVPTGVVVDYSTLGQISMTVNSLPVVLAGDYNNNGVVDTADYVVWRENEGTNNLLSNNPIAGTIGQAHYNQWRSNFGDTTPGAGAGVGAGAVPEPGTLLLAAMVLALGCGWRRRG